MCYNKAEWQVWEHLIGAWACALSNAADPDDKRKKERETEYEDHIRLLGNAERAAVLFGILIELLEDNPWQDLLGSLYMELELNSHWKGQFFTPYHICKVMSKSTITEQAKERVKQGGWIAVADPACGSGATLIATADILKNEKEVNYQEAVVFAAQDIDRITAQMCYVQMSLLGMAGYVVVADTLTNPIVGAGSALLPIQQDNQEYWYTPMWWMDTWEIRRVLEARRIRQGGVDVEISHPLEKRAESYSPIVFVG